MNKPEALRLADALDAVPETGADPDLIQEAAAELRRLSAENELLGSAADKLRLAWRDEVQALIKEKDELIAQRDALLEVLQDMLNAKNDYPYGGMSESEISAIRKARAAIKAVEGDKT